MIKKKRNEKKKREKNEKRKMEKKKKKKKTTKKRKKKTKKDKTQNQHNQPKQINKETRFPTLFSPVEELRIGLGTPLPLLRPLRCPLLRGGGRSEIGEERVWNYGLFMGYLNIVKKKAGR